MPYTTRIEGNAFLRCSNLTNINCPNLEIIGDYAFQGSGVSWTRFPFKIITIGGSAFRQCSQLVNVVMPSGLQSIGELAFYQCTALQTFDLSECLQIPTLGANAFAYTTCTFLFRDQTQLDAYASATNWSTYADRFQIKGA